VLRKGGQSHLIMLKSRAKALGDKHVLIREVQADPVKENVLHVDFEGVSLTEKITVEVPLAFRGTPAGEEEGGKADVKIYELEIECRADRIPDEIEVDISHMDVGDVMHAEDLILPEGVDLAIDPARTIVLVNVPRMAAVLAAEEAAEAEAAAEEAPEEGAEEGEAPETTDEEETEDEETED
jgi:large subunit ribosomal protein L25